MLRIRKSKRHVAFDVDLGTSKVEKSWSNMMISLTACHGTINQIMFDALLFSDFIQKFLPKIKRNPSRDVFKNQDQDPGRCIIVCIAIVDGQSWTNS